MKYLFIMLLIFMLNGCSNKKPEVLKDTPSYKKKEILDLVKKKFIEDLKYGLESVKKEQDRREMNSFLNIYKALRDE